MSKKAAYITEFLDIPQIYPEISGTPDAPEPSPSLLLVVGAAGCSSSDAARLMRRGNAHWLLIGFTPGEEAPRCRRQ